MRHHRLPALVAMLLFLMPGAAAAARLQIATVPAVAGIRFTLDGVGFKSGADGVARISVGAGSHVLTTTLIQRPSPWLQARLIRWDDGAPLARRTVQVRSRTRIRAGLVTS